MAWHGIITTVYATYTIRALFALPSDFGGGVFFFWFMHNIPNGTTPSHFYAAGTIYDQLGCWRSVCNVLGAFFFPFPFPTIDLW